MGNTVTMPFVGSKWLVKFSVIGNVSTFELQWVMTLLPNLVE